MSRHALWQPTAPLPGGSAADTRAQMPHGPAGPAAARIPSPATIPAQGATGRAVGAVLARMADLHEQLSQATRELEVLVRNHQNCLAGIPDSRLMSSVETPTRLFTAEDLAARLQVDARTIRRWRKAGKIPLGIEIAGVLRWRADEIDLWLAEGGRA